MMEKDGGKKKNTMLKNVLVTIGCALFAGVYVFGGCYIVSFIAGNGNESAAMAWQDEEEDHAGEDQAVSEHNDASSHSDASPQELWILGGGKDNENTAYNENDETEEETEEEEALEETQTEESAKDSVEVSHVQVIQPAESSPVLVADVTAVVKAAMPCVVSITNEYTAYDYWYGEEVDEEINGSGIIVSQNGEELLIVTNYHVIEGNDSLYVQFINDEEVIAYEKGTAPDNDLAIIAVFLEDLTDDTLESIAIAALGDSDSLQVGEPAIAIGNSLGYGQSVTTGVISALNRDIFADDPDINQGYLIQTDAAINPGNSGGALLNVNGEVVGINSSKIADYVIEGMGYAIPISTAKPIINELMKQETKRKVPVDERAFLGISGTDVTEDANARYEMPEGAYVSDVLRGTAADKAGILKGDIITYIDGEKISRMSELQSRLEYYAAGTEVELTIMRQTNGEYKEIKIKVTLERR